MEICGWRIDTIVVDDWANFDTVTPRQEHGSRIVSAADAAADPTVRADGVYAEAGETSAFGVVSADCLPLVLCNERMAVAVHISRKTLIHGILDSVRDIVDGTRLCGAYIGPHICAEHFTFARQGDDIRTYMRLFSESWHVDGSLLHISLRDAVDHFLHSIGVVSEQIERDGRCTYEAVDLPSYRREYDAKAATGPGRIVTRVVSASVDGS